MSDLVLKNVKKSYDRKNDFFSDLSFEIENGEFVVILGGEGSGKSAILRLVAGLDNVDGGELLIGGELSNDLVPKDRNVAMIFPDHQLIPHMTAYDNMAFGLKLRKVPATEIDIKVREAARIMSLEDVLSRKPKMLTALQRQRVALARAIVREPNLYLFDDSLTNFDDELTKTMRQELIKLHYRLGATFVFATRDQIDALTLATKIMVINGGKIEQFDTPTNIYLNPRTVYVADYVGSPKINLAPCEAVDTNGEKCLKFGGFSLKTDDARDSLLADYFNSDKGLTAGIRPEDLKICDDGEISATVTGVENYGNYKVAAVKVPFRTVDEWQILIGNETEIKQNDEIKLKIELDKLHLFDRMSEINLKYQ